MENNIEIKHDKYGFYRHFLKRLMDFVFSFFAIILLSPVFVVVGILVRIKIGKPILFKQKRPGYNERIFTMYKFRTMTDKKDDSGLLLEDSMRLTRFGKILRTTSLDELPELFNIIKGDMSFVGPRPLLIQYLELYDDNQKRRHDVRPGLSGLAQVNGRNAITWEEKFLLDEKYVDEYNFVKDLKILLLTIKKVIVREGINQEGEATMEVFKGSGKLEQSGGER